MVYAKSTEEEKEEKSMDHSYWFATCEHASLVSLAGIAAYFIWALT